MKIERKVLFIWLLVVTYACGFSNADDMAAVAPAYFSFERMHARVAYLQAEQSSKAAWLRAGVAVAGAGVLVGAAVGASYWYNIRRAPSVKVDSIALEEHLKQLEYKDRMEKLAGKSFYQYMRDMCSKTLKASTAIALVSQGKQACSKIYTAIAAWVRGSKRDGCGATRVSNALLLCHLFSKSLANTNLALQDRLFFSNQLIQAHNSLVFEMEEFIAVSAAEATPEVQAWLLHERAGLIGILNGCSTMVNKLFEAPLEFASYKEFEDRLVSLARVIDESTDILRALRG